MYIYICIYIDTCHCYALYMHYPRLELWEFPVQGSRQGDAAILQASRYSGASAVGLG